MATRETKSRRKPAAKKQPATKTKTSAARTAKASAKTKKAVAKKPVAVKKASPANAAGNKATKTAKKLTAASLFAWNKWLTVVYLLQAAVLLVLSTTKTLPLTTGFLAEDPLASEGGETVFTAASKHLADVNVAYALAAFLLVLAVAHGLLATLYRKRYERGLDARVNGARWTLTGISGGLMVAIVGLLLGVQDVSALFALFVLTVVASLTVLGMERQGKSTWLGCFAACLAAVVPWVVFSVYLIGGAMAGGAVPAFVYFVFASIFLIFLGFAINVYQQFRGQGKWADYLYTERNYALLTLVAATALTWQVFAGVLNP